MELKELSNAGVSWFTKPLESDPTLLKNALFFTFLFGVLTNFFFITTLMPSHDELNFFCNKAGTIENMVALGRPLAPIYLLVAQAALVTPFITGLTGLFLIGLSVYLCVKIFNLRTAGEVAATAAIFSSNRTVICQIASFNDTMVGYMAALFFACLMVTSWESFIKTKKIRHFILSAVFIALSLGSYQAYIAVAITIIMIKSILRLFDGEEVKKVFIDGVMAIGSLALGAVFYFLLIKLSCTLFGINLNSGSYNSITNIADNKEPVIVRIKDAYKKILFNYVFMTKDVVTIIPEKVIQLVLFLIFLLYSVGFVWAIKSTRPKKIAIALSVALAALLPLSCNLTRLFNHKVHELMIFSVWILWLLPLLLFPRCRCKKRYLIPYIFFLSIIIFNNIQVGNTLGVVRKLGYDATYSLMTQIISKVEALPDYTEGETPVALIGGRDRLAISKDTFSSIENYDLVSKITGIHNAGTAITYNDSFVAFFKTIMLRKGKFISTLDATELGKTEKIKDMPVYPKKGSIALVDGVAVIKLSQIMED